MTTAIWWLRPAPVARTCQLQDGRVTNVELDADPKEIRR